MLAVLKTEDDGGAIEVFGFVNAGGWAQLPDGSMVSPAKSGMVGEGYEIQEVENADMPPDGLIPTGDRHVGIVNGKPKWIEGYKSAYDELPELTHRQFWLAAWDVGITKQSVTAKVLSNYPEGERERIAMEVELTTSFSRNHPLVDELCVMSGLSPVELDALWIWAASI